MQRATGYVIYRALVVSLYLMKMLVVGEVPPPLKTVCGSDEYEASYARHLPHAEAIWHWPLGMGKLFLSF